MQLHMRETILNYVQDLLYENYGGIVLVEAFNGKNISAFFTLLLVGSQSHAPTIRWLLSALVNYT